MKLPRRCKTAPLAAAVMLVLAAPLAAQPTLDQPEKVQPAAAAADKAAGQAEAASGQKASAEQGAAAEQKAAAGQGAAAGQKAPAGQDAPADQKAPAAQGTPAAQQDSTAKAEPAAEAELKVGFVLPTTPDGSGWSRSHQQGIDALRQQLGDRVAVTVLDNVKDVDAEKAFRKLVEDGNRLIFGTGATYEALMKRLALEYPDVRWEVAGLGTSAGNIRSYGVRAYEGVYLAGVAAGKMTRVKVAWVNGWADPVRETEATQTLISGGADVIIYNTATTDPLKQAERVGKYAFGWGADMSQAAPKAHLGSVAFDWAGYYVQTVQQVLDKRWKPAPTWQGLRDGRVDLVALSDKLTPEARAAVEEKRKALRDGTLQIWKGPLVTVDDRELLPSGKVGDDRFLEGLMTYVKGVAGQVPAGR